MATPRFGAVTSPAQAFATKIRWLVAFLVFTLLLCFGTIVALLRSSDNPQLSIGNPADVTASVPSPSSPTVDILVARQRIEEGTMITEGMFTVESKPPTQVPQGALLASERMEVVGKYAATLIRPSFPILREDINTNPPVNLLNIPPGYRAVTILIDKRTGVEGWARPGSRVDVMWTYNNPKGETMVKTIVYFAKILSVQGAVSGDPNQKAAVAGKDTTATLLVTEKDAKKIELARSTGSLSLTLVGDQVGDNRTEPIDGESVTLETILGGAKQDTEVAEEPVQGRAYMTDPRTGRQSLYVLKRGQWVPADTALKHE